MTEWHSWWAFLFIPLVLFAMFYHWFKRKDLSASVQFSALKNLKGLHRGLRAYLSELPTVVKVLGLILAICALARPQESNTKIKRSVEGIDIMVVLDISDSMLIEDMQPENRIESSKKFIAESIQNRSSDRIGLIIF